MPYKFELYNHKNKWEEFQEYIDCEWDDYEGATPNHPLGRKKPLAFHERLPPEKASEFID